MQNKLMLTAFYKGNTYTFDIDMMI